MVLTQALEQYEEALKIRRALAKEHPATYLPDVAMTLINMSIFYLQSVPDKEKSVSLAIEVIKIGIEFQQIPIVQKYMETAIQILQANGVDLDELFKE